MFNMKKQKLLINMIR